MESRYRGAGVGYGNLGARHAEVMSGLERIRLVAVADEVAEARARAEQDWPGVTAERRKRGDRSLIEMRGPKGRLRLSGGAFDAVYLARGAYPEDVEHHIPWQPVALPARPERPTMSYMAATIAPVYEQLIRTIEHGEPHPCNGVGGRRAMEMISAIFASHFAGGRR